MTSDLVSSQGLTAIVGVLTIINSVIGIVVAAVTLPTVGLQGYIIASAFMFVPCYIILLRKMNASLQIHAPFSELRPLFYALPFSGAFLFLILLLPLTAPIELILGAAVTCITYPVFLALFRGLNLSDTKHMRTMLSAQPAVAKVMEPVVRMLERVVRAVTGRTVTKDD